MDENRFVVLDWDGKSTGLTVIVDRSPRLVGEYRLRGLQCLARLPATGVPVTTSREATTVTAITAASALVARLLEALELQRKGDYRNAATAAQDAATGLARHIGADHPLTLRAAAAQSWSMTYAGQADPAVELATRAWTLQAARLGPVHPDTRSTRANIAWQLFVAGRTADGIAFAEETLAVLGRELGTGDRTYVRLFGQLGTLYAANGQAQKARETLERTLDLQKTAGSDRAEGIATRNNLAIVYLNLGLPGERLELLTNAARDANEFFGADHPQALGVHVNLADAMLAVGQQSAALEMAERTRTGLVARLGPRHPNVALVDKLLGQIYKALGRFDVALAAVESAIDIYSGSLGPEHPRTIFCINDRAGLFGALGRNVDAAAEQRRAYELAARVMGAGNLETLKYQSNLAWTALIAGDAAGALESAVAADKGLANLGPSGALLRTRNARLIALANAAIGDVSGARRLLEQVAIDMERVSGPLFTDTLVARAQLGDLQRRDGDPTAAKATLRAVVNDVENIRADIGLTPDQRAAFSQLAFDAYTSLAELLIDEGSLSDAFDIVERSKARRLLDDLTERRADSLALLDAGDRRKIEDGQRRIAWLDETIASGTDPAYKLSLEIERNQRYRALAELRKSLRSKHPRYQQLSTVRLVDSATLRKLLPRGSIFVSYFTANERLHALTVDPGGAMRSIHLGPIAPIARLVHAIRSASTTATLPGQDVESLARQLARELIEPLGIDAATRTWIIAPDGDLTLLPFELLTWRDAALVATVNVQYVQSASVYALLHERRNEYRSDSRRLDMFAVGGALYSGDPATRGGLTLRAAGDSAAKGGAHRAQGDRALIWPDLPQSEVEARNVAGLFRKSRVLLRERASESELRLADRNGELAQYRYLLFSTHGYLDLESPQLSAVVLSQVQTEADDGYVTAAEWPAYHLRSDLTVLSACETGLGQRIRGEGVWGLPYALFVAGNVNTMVTLWPVADEGTARFVQRFFARVRAGRGHAQALAETKREFLSDRKLRAPLYWAGFVLYGV